MNQSEQYRAWSIFWFLAVDSEADGSFCFWNDFSLVKKSQLGTDDRNYKTHHDTISSPLPPILVPFATLARISMQFLSHTLYSTVTIASKRSFLPSFVSFHFLVAMLAFIHIQLNWLFIASEYGNRKEKICILFCLFYCIYLSSCSREGTKKRSSINVSFVPPPAPPLPCLAFIKKFRKIHAIGLHG